jgi:hypothetical protein
MTLSGLVHQAYPSPEWAVFFEVANSTGFGAHRRADAVALGVWPSRGHTIVGFEFKDDRRDWLREKKNPAKGDVIAAHCDAWWVVAGTDAVVSADELPEPWGLYVANKDRTRLLTKKPAQPFPDRDKVVMKRSFVAAMLRKVSETTIPLVEVQRRVDDAVKLARESTREGRELADLRDLVEKQRAVFETFKATTGVDMRGWQGPTRIAAAVHAVLNLDNDRHALEMSVARLDQAATTVREALAAWPTSSVVREHVG